LRKANRVGNVSQAGSLGAIAAVEASAYEELDQCILFWRQSCSILGSADLINNQLVSHDLFIPVDLPRFYVPRPANWLTAFEPQTGRKPFSKAKFKGNASPRRTFTFSSTRPARFRQPNPATHLRSGDETKAEAAKQSNSSPPESASPDFFSGDARPSQPPAIANRIDEVLAKYAKAHCFSLLRTTHVPCGRIAEWAGQAVQVAAVPPRFAILPPIQPNRPVVVAFLRADGIAFSGHSPDVHGTGRPTALWKDGSMTSISS